MKRVSAAFALAIIPLFGMAQTQKSSAVQKVTVQQLTDLLAAAHGQDDALLAAQLSGLQLTERVNAARRDKLTARLPGDKSAEALTILLDSAALLPPAADEVVSNPTPAAPALRQMMVSIVNYANSSLHQFPNFIAARITTAFEDRPQEDVLESTGTVSYSYLPLHFVHRESVVVTYRDGHEVLDASGKVRENGATAHGLQTAGEFGPFLSTVLADAVKGKITWSRWEQGVDGTDAVFHYQVSKGGSHYLVRFCCTREDISESIPTHVYSEAPAYHGDIAFNPVTGAVMRISVEAEMTPGELVQSAGIILEYAPVQIGAKTVILPVRSVSILQAHTSAPPPGMHMAIYNGAAKTFLNGTAFENYRQYRGEMRMVSDGSAPQ